MIEKSSLFLLSFIASSTHL